MLREGRPATAVDVARTVLLDNTHMSSKAYPGCLIILPAAHLGHLFFIYNMQHLFGHTATSCCANICTEITHYQFIMSATTFAKVCAIPNVFFVRVWIAVWIQSSCWVPRKPAKQCARVCRTHTRMAGEWEQWSWAQEKDVTVCERGLERLYAGMFVAHCGAVCI